MELVKKNLVSIICGLIFIAALVALFWPIGGYYAQLHTEVEARTGVYNSIRGILDKDRRRPVTALGNNAEPQKLEVFPTDATIKDAHAVVDKLKTQAASMLDKAVKLNEHKPLVDGALPEGSPARWTRYVGEYKDRFNVISPKSVVKEILHGGFPPNEADIVKARADKEAQIKAQVVPGPNGAAINQPMIDAQLAQALPAIGQDMIIAAANDCQIYVDYAAQDPSTLIMTPPSVPMGQTGGIDSISIFNSQVDLWLYEDVAAAIAAANKGAKNVTESAVKQLIKFDAVDDPFKAAAGGPAVGEPGAAPAVAGPSDPSAPITKNFSVSMTGRVANPVYDVIPFDLKLIVDASQVSRVIQELSRSRLITVTNVALMTVDSDLKHSQGFYFGDVPVVELDLRCEALMLRKWTEPLMPMRVRQALGIPITPTAPGGG